jgi:arsenate reductase
MNKIKVLFLCVANSCRSQMAEGLLRHYYGDKFEAYSAGSKATFVHPLAIEVMKEIGVDISNHRSKLVSEFFGQSFDYVITVCGDSSKSTCPMFIGEVKRETLHWNFPDPAEAEGSLEEKLAVFRQVRDEIKKKIDNFVIEITSK